MPQTEPLKRSIHSNKQIQLSQPIWLTALAGSGLFWYAYGLYQCWNLYTASQATSQGIQADAFTTDHLNALQAFPTLIWIAFAIASLAGLIGTALLVVKNLKAKIALALSTISGATYYLWIYVLSEDASKFPEQDIFIAITVMTVTLCFLAISFIYPKRLG